MIKVIPRVYVDLNIGEVFSALGQILNVKKATTNGKLREFEDAYARYIGTTGAVSFPSCRSAMFFSLKALNLGEGDEVILPAFTFWVDAAVVVMAGLKPVFIDVDLETGNMDVSKIREAITSRTKVIFPTHLNGMPADMDAMMAIAEEYKLRVLEDSARSCGATYKGKRVGSFDIGTFSFGYGKSFYDFGGGMVTSNDSVFISQLRKLKEDFNKITPKSLYLQTLKGVLLRYLNIPLVYRFSLYPLMYEYQVEGNEKFASMFKISMPTYDNVPKAFTIDMHNVQAKTGLSQLERIDKTNRKRMEHVNTLNRELADVSEITIPPQMNDREFTAVHYAIWSDRKEELQTFLIKNKIDAQDESAIDNSKLERFSSFSTGCYPNADKLHKKTLFIPTHPYLSNKDMVYMASKVKEFFKRS